MSRHKRHLRVVEKFEQLGYGLMHDIDDFKERCIDASGKLEQHVCRCPSRKPDRGKLSFAKGHNPMMIGAFLGSLLKGNRKTFNTWKEASQWLSRNFHQEMLRDAIMNG